MEEIAMNNDVNRDKKPIVIGKDDWNATQETLFLVNQGVDRRIRERENEPEEDFDKAWNE
jgi:PHD/YefM family antitoxin component YafN of YafNO toxin-antitoxin module